MKKIIVLLLCSLVFIPVIRADESGISVKSESGIIMEASTGKVLFEKEADTPKAPASMTKIMTMLLIMEAIDDGRLSMDDQVNISKNASGMGGSQAYLEENTTSKVSTLLTAIAVGSANDASVAMAEKIGGTEENFVNMMNKRAKELGAENTTFKNPHGLDEEGHLTTARDLAIIARELITKHEEILKLTSTYETTITHANGKSLWLVNTNKLIRNYKGITGLKTGSTSLALYNLSASATREGLSLIAVIMKGPTSAIRFSDAQKLLDYGFSNYSYKSFANQNEVIKSVTVTKGVNQEVNAIYETSPAFLIKKGDESNINYEVSLANTVQAPVYEGQLLGTVKYFLNDTELGIVNLVAESSVNEVGLLNMNKHIFANWFSLLRL